MTVCRRGGGHWSVADDLQFSVHTGPTDLYQQPLTTSQMFGWWVKNGHPEKEPWAQSERHAHVNSEMTRWVCSLLLIFSSIIILLSCSDLWTR